MKHKNTFLVLGIVLLIVAFVVFLVKTPGKTGELDKFAQCLGEKGVIFYGAFWCPNCQNQKAMFGRSSKELPYVECSTPDGKRQLSECSEKGIEAYPTWIFEDGKKIEGVISLEDLRDKTDCPLPKTN